MFERFTRDARLIVVSAQEQAGSLGHRHIGTEHLLLALAARSATPAAALLAEHGLRFEAVRQHVVDAVGSAASGEAIDAGALDAIGIDLDAVRERVEATFGAGALDRPAPERPGRSKRPTVGHLPFTKRAKKVLELALREAIRLGHREIGDGHLLLGLLREGSGLGYRTIVDAGIDIDALRAEVESSIPAD